jgi:hypothetical protein
VVAKVRVRRAQYGELETTLFAVSYEFKTRLVALKCEFPTPNS